MKAMDVKPAVLAVSLILGISTLPGCGKSETAQELIASALQSLEKRDNNAAVIALKNALIKDPENAQARALLGKVYLELGDLEAADRELSKAQSQGADKAMTVPLLARLLIAQGKFQDVLSNTAADEQYGPEANAKIYIQHGTAYTALRQFDQAKSVYQKAIALQPNNSEVYLGMAVLSVVLGELADAYRHLDTALEKNHNNTMALQLKGDLLRNDGKRDEAMAVYRKITVIDPKNVGAMVSITSLLLDEGKLDKAREEIELAERRVSKSLVVKYFKALVDYRQNKLEEADTGVQEVLKYTPDNLQALLLSGLIQGARGSYEIAETRFNRVLALDPNNFFAKKRLIALLLQRKQTDQAIKQVNDLLTNHPKDPELLALAAQAYMDVNQLDKATGFLERSAELNPQSSAVRTRLALIQLAKGNLKEGISDLEQAAAMDSAAPQTDALLIVNSMRAGDYEKALKAAQAAERKQPKNPVFLNLKGGVYIAMKDYGNARKTLESALAIDPLYMSAVANLAKLDLLDKKPQSARKRFEQVLDKDENNLTAMMAMAELAQSQNKADEAINWLKKATKAHPDSVQPWTQLVAAYLQNKQPEKAVHAASEAQRAYPSSAYSYDLLGSAQLANKQNDDALTSFRKMSQLLPKSPVPYLKIARAYAAKNDINSARNSLLKSLELEPKYFDGQVALIQLEVAASNFTAATKVARLIQAANPKKAVGHSLEGDILLAQKQFPAAARVYEKAYSIEKSGVLATKVHLAMSQANSASSADKAIRDWLRTNPNDVATRTYLADNNIQKAQYREAIAEYEVILKTVPNNAAVLNNLAGAYQQVGDARMFEIAERAYKLQPENAAIMDTLGWILVDQGKDVSRGIGLLSKAVKGMGNNPEIRYHYGAALAKKGDKAAAKKEIQQALSISSNFPSAERARALLRQL